MRKLIKKVGRWFKRLLARLRRPNLTQLREFVYLDEISVVSLSSSLRGALAEEITDSESSTLKTDSKFEIGTRNPYLKSKVGYGTELSSTEGRQILRKSTIQSKYKDLIDDLSDRLKVFHYSQDIPAPPETSKLLDKIKDWEAGDKVDWFRSADEFVRGDLVEFEVALAADVVYGAGLTLSSMAGVLKRIGQVDHSGLSEAAIDQLQVLSEVLTQLLIGLIPIKSKVIGWKAVEYNKKTFIATDTVAATLTNSKQLKILPLYITGVLEESLFWKDVRQVLFNDHRMKVLCRITGPMSKDWNPIKMFDVLASILPSMPDELLALSKGRWLQDSFSRDTTPALSNNSFAVNIDTLIRKYVDTVFKEEQLDIPSDKIDTLVVSVLSSHKLDGSYTSVVNTLKGVDEAMNEELNINIASDKLVGYRNSVIAAVSADSDDTTREVLERYIDQDAEEYYIDTEVISIYW